MISTRQEYLLSLLPAQHSVDFLLLRKNNLQKIFFQLSNVHPNQWYAYGYDLRIALERFKNIFSLTADEIEAVITVVANQLIMDECATYEARVHMLKILNDMLSIRGKLPSLQVQGQKLLQFKRSIQKAKYPAQNHSLLIEMYQKQSNYLIKRLAKYVVKQPINCVDNRQTPSPLHSTFPQKVFQLSKFFRDMRITAVFAHALPSQGIELLLEQLFSLGIPQHRSNAWWFILMKIAKNNKGLDFSQYMHRINHQLFKNINNFPNNNDFFFGDNFNSIKSSAKSAMELLVQLIRPDTHSNFQVMWSLVDRLFLTINCLLDPQNQADNSCNLFKLLKYFTIKFVDRFNDENGISRDPSNQDQLDPPRLPPVRQSWTLDKSCLQRFEIAMKVVVKKLIFMEDEGYIVAKILANCSQVCPSLVQQIFAYLQQILEQKEEVSLTHLKNVMLYMITVFYDNRVWALRLFSLLNKVLLSISSIGITQNTDFFEIVARLLVYCRAQFRSCDQAQKLIRTSLQIIIQNLQLIAASFCLSIISSRFIFDLKNIFHHLLQYARQDTIRTYSLALLARILTVIPQEGSAFCSLLSAFCFHCEIAGSLLDKIDGLLFRSGFSAPILFLKSDNFVLLTQNLEHLEWYYSIILASTMYRPDLLFRKKEILFRSVNLALKRLEGNVFDLGCQLICSLIRTCNNFAYRPEMLDKQAKPCQQPHQSSKELCKFIMDNYFQKAVASLEEMCPPARPVGLQQIFDDIMLGSSNNKLQQRKQLWASMSVVLACLQGLCQKVVFCGMTDHFSDKKYNIRGRMIQLLKKLVTLYKQAGLFSDFKLVKVLLQFKVFVLGETPLSESVSQASDKINVHRCIQNQDIIFSKGPILLAHLEAQALRNQLIDFCYMQEGWAHVVDWMELNNLLIHHPDNDEISVIRFFIRKDLMKAEDFLNAFTRFVDLFVNKLIGKEGYINQLSNQKKQSNKHLLLQNAIQKIIKIIKKVFKQGNQYFVITSDFCWRKYVDLIPVLPRLNKKSDRVLLYETLLALISYNNQSTLMLKHAQLVIYGSNGPVKSNSSLVFGQFNTQFQLNQQRNWILPLIERIRRTIEVKKDLTWRELHLYGAIILQLSLALYQDQLQQLLQLFIVLGSTQNAKINQIGRAGFFRIIDLLKHKRHVKQKLDFVPRKLPFKEFLIWRHSPKAPGLNRFKDNQNEFYVCFWPIKKYMKSTGLKKELAWNKFFSSLEIQKYQGAVQEESLQSNIQKSLYNYWGKVNWVRGLYHCSLVVGPAFDRAVQTHLEFIQALPQVSEQQRSVAAYLSIVMFVRCQSSTIVHFVEVIRRCSNQLMTQIVEMMNQLLPYGNVMELRPLFQDLIRQLKQLKGVARHRYFQIWNVWVQVYGRWAFENDETLLQHLNQSVDEIAQAQGFMKTFISSMIGSIIVSVNTKQLDRWVVEPLEQLIQEQKIIYLSKDIILQRNPILLEITSKFVQNLNRDRRGAQGKIFGEMAVKLAETISVIIFNPMLLQLYKPIISYIVQVKQSQINEEEVLKRFAEAEFPPDIFNETIELVLLTQGNRPNALSKKLFLLRQLMAMQTFASNKLTAIPELPVSVKSAELVSSLLQVATYDQIVFQYQQAFSIQSNISLNGTPLKDPEWYRLMLLMGLVLRSANERWTDEGPKLKSLKLQAVSQICQNKKQRKLVTEWGSLLVKGKPNPSECFGQSWRYLSGLVGSYTYMM